jgi:lipopolysaccharide/colanic/teichoic acid biosynthesis glycosyltransferase
MSDTTTFPNEPSAAGTHPRLVPVRSVDADSFAARAYLAIRAVVEWPAAVILLVAAMPVLGTLAGILKFTSPGPILYSQMRLGKDGRRFRIYKLRTMVHECETGTGPVWSSAGDPRVTRVGRWLRDTHLDELPQLWNVVRGDMSLFGPRPERPEIAEQIERWLPEYRDRLAVRPGIAGLAQVILPPDADLMSVRRKLAYDLRYIQDVGPLMDARVALATVLHCAGLIASVVSRLLAQPSTPPPMIEPKGPMPHLGLSMAEQGLRPVSTAKEETELSKVA